jgi:hypothetical protein
MQRGEVDKIIYTHVNTCKNYKNKFYKQKKNANQKFINWWMVKENSMYTQWRSSHSQRRMKLSQTSGPGTVR